MGGPKKKTNKYCSIEGCSNIFSTKGMCLKHYRQMYRFGYTKERTNMEPNEFIIEGDICKMFLYNNKGETIAETLIDIEDIEKIKTYKWALCNGYVYNWKIKALSSFLLGIKTNYKIVVDHKNGNPLDNRKQNLQIVTHQQNIIKRKQQKNNKSGYRGVFWHKNSKRWLVNIRFDQQDYYLGCFISKKAAVETYNEKAKELFGRFAVLNIFESKEEIEKIKKGTEKERKNEG